MTTLFIDLVLVFWLLLFGGMALLPIITGTTRQGHAGPVEDHVISIDPARQIQASAQGRRTPLVPHNDRDQHDRPAA